MVKIITMVKDEVDIVSDWVLYHGYIFGFQNIYVIDNYSTDGTYEELLKFKDLITVSRETTYNKKGKYMRSYIDKYCEDGEIAFPMDIDEFIVHFDYSTRQISVDKNILINYIKNLPPHNVYKMNYIWGKFTHNDVDNHPNGFMHASSESKYGQLGEFNMFSKGFINTNLNKGDIDMGNHFLKHDYHKTELCLIHFHCRNLDQMKKKILNNILGLGYKNEIKFLKVLANKCNTEGIHHVHNQISVLKNEYKFIPSQNDKLDIKLDIFTDFINNIKVLIEQKNILKQKNAIKLNPHKIYGQTFMLTNKCNPTLLNKFKNNKIITILPNTLCTSNTSIHSSILDSSDTPIPIPEPIQTPIPEPMYNRNKQKKLLRQLVISAIK